MSEVILFNHIPKTAGSTMKEVLWRAVGGERVLFATRIGAHLQQLGEIRRRLDRPLEDSYAVVAHTGVGVEVALPERHRYRPFTILRDPVQRTISEFFYARDDRAALPAELSLEEYLSEQLLRSYNSQTAFLGGLSARHHLEGEPLSRDRYDAELLARAKSNLEAHDVVGLTERFDETLLLLRHAYGWPVLRTLYRPANVGAARRTAAPRLTEPQLEAVRANNELDLELYDHARELFASRLEELRVDGRLRRFRRLNATYARAFPLAHPPTRAIVQGARRLRGRVGAERV